MKIVLKALGKYTLQLILLEIPGVLVFIVDVLGFLDWLGIAGELVPGLGPLERLFVILAISFVIANPLIYIKQALEKQSLEDHIARHEADEANIHLEVMESGFQPSGTSTTRSFRDVKVDPYGFDECGLPGWGVIWASLKITNIGYEAGKLICDFDRPRTKLPSLFDPNFVISASTDVLLRDSISIEGRSSRTAHLSLDIRITERDREAFVRVLNSLDNYRVIIVYRTKRIDGESEPRFLKIEGDFQGFRQQVLEHWKHSKHRDLAQIAASR